ncbi:MAG: hypothetical protein GX575_14265 [Candidatus Anammoximicrobium sp.]|nr:hypothetical protein [Candidatus Anammoximicrobium sp.]
MERKDADRLPTLIADTETLRQQLQELYASVKAQSARRREQAEPSAGAGMVIRGK